MQVLYEWESERKSHVKRGDQTLRHLFWQVLTRHLRLWHNINVLPASPPKPSSKTHQVHTATPESMCQSPFRRRVACRHMHRGFTRLAVWQKLNKQNALTVTPEKKTDFTIKLSIIAYLRKPVSVWWSRYCSTQLETSWLYIKLSLKLCKISWLYTGQERVRSIKKGLGNTSLTWCEPTDCLRVCMCITVK